MICTASAAARGGATVALRMRCKSTSSTSIFSRISGLRRLNELDMVARASSLDDKDYFSGTAIPWGSESQNRNRSGRWDDETIIRNGDASGRGHDETKMPTLEEHGTNLAKLAEEGKLDPVVGREQQISRVITILGRRTKNHACLIGEPGVGKTAIAEGLAQRIASGDVPKKIAKKKVISLDMALLVSGTKYRGDFEGKLKMLLEEIKKSDGQVILFIDEVYTLIGAGAAEGGIDVANLLKPTLARGKLQCIGATTLDEYIKHIEKDPTLKRRFQPVKVPEPIVDETIQILRGLLMRAIFAMILILNSLHHYHF